VNAGDRLRDLVAAALAEDLGAGDITSEAVVAPDAKARARVVQKQSGVLYGLDAAEEAFRQAGAQRFESLAPEGEWRDAVPAEVASVEGTARSLLAAERTALNFLCHLSGIATLTARFARGVEGTGAEVLDTRKTTPGLRALEKAAVAVGGGANHRMGLHDAVLIKENHVALAGGVAAAVRRAREAHPEREIEIECRNIGEVDEALDAGADRLLLDNMDLEGLRSAVAARDAAARAHGPLATLEASGGITLEGVADIAATGVDFVSVGAITHSAPALDLSVELEPTGESDQAPETAGPDEAPEAAEPDRVTEAAEAKARANVDALRPVYAAWGRGDWATRPEVYASDMSWGYSSEFPHIHGMTSDPEEAAEKLRSWLSPWEDWRAEAEEYVPAGDLVVVLARYRGRGKGSGVEVDVEGAHVWKMRDGQAIQIEVFSDRRLALRSAGLEAE
jgi:nicotinate-nucleotide pyrophosphorylase (carboxylating)